MLLDTGMRLAEFLSQNMEAADPITGMILIPSGKSRKPRNVYLGDKSRQSCAGTSRNARITTRRSGSQIRRTPDRNRAAHDAAAAAAKPGVPVPSPHDFRRAFAIERWRARSTS
ncbi:MAG: tyrosine-type recombinase/integrase [Anaerolineales bacterium]|nr:tyrosine-type recombinase/integrase [Anaerolineales bacterium]